MHNLHPRYRTPLCVLFPPRIIAAACHVYAQRILDGEHSPSLDSRLSFTAPSTSLPTPPSHKPLSPDASRFVIEHYSFDDSELTCVKGECNPWLASMTLTCCPCRSAGHSDRVLFFPECSGIDPISLSTCRGVIHSCLNNLDWLTASGRSCPPPFSHRDHLTTPQPQSHHTPVNP